MIENLSGIDDDPKTPKTYYIRITAVGRQFWKFGVAHSTVRRRYASCLGVEKIDILNIWPHKTLEKAKAHEARLFRENKGDMPYIGRCGPLPNAGNTEVYSHDVLNGEKPPAHYFVRVLSLESYPFLLVAYDGEDPRTPYRHLHGIVRYMDWMEGPEPSLEGDYLQVPANSSFDRITIATEAYLRAAVDKQIGNRSFDVSRAGAEEALRLGILVKSWRDRPKFQAVLGRPFSLKGADWRFAPHISSPGAIA